MPGIVRSCERDGEREREICYEKKGGGNVSHTHFTYILYICM